MNPVLMNEQDRTLRAHIMSYISMAGSAIQREDVQILGDGIFEFVRDLVGKFERGQREHGGRLLDRNLDQELRQEMLDVTIYNIYQNKKTQIAADRKADQTLLTSQKDLVAAIKITK